METEKTVANSPSTSRCTTPMPSLPSDNGTEETREEKDGEEVGEKMIDLDSSDVE